MSTTTKTQGRDFEVVYTHPDGREEVRYRRNENSPDAHSFIFQVQSLIELHGKDCPYSIRFLPKQNPIPMPTPITYKSQNPIPVFTVLDRDGEPTNHQAVHLSYVRALQQQLEEARQIAQHFAVCGSCAHDLADCEHGRKYRDIMDKWNQEPQDPQEPQ